MRAITVDAIRLHTIAMSFTEPLRTSFGGEMKKAAIIVEALTTEGVTGWGEISVQPEPGYSGETIGTAHHITSNFLVPALLGQTLEVPGRAAQLMRHVRGNEHAKHGVEAAIWDAFAKTNDLRLADLFAESLPEGNASRGVATVGVSIGIQESVEDTLAIIQKRLDQGYKRIKLKIQPGWDVELARAIRDAMPDLVMMLDANSAYTLADAEHLKQLDSLSLLMIEQPLAHNDIYEHAQLQQQMLTAICLDESVKSVSDLRAALALEALQILNLKPARVGGFTEALAMYAICVETGTRLWIGGMMETGVGRAANVALASLPGVVMPSDISATDRYFEPDITEPPFVLGPRSTLAVPDAPGIGLVVRRDRLSAATINVWDSIDFVSG